MRSILVKNAPAALYVLFLAIFLAAGCEPSSPPPSDETTPAEAPPAEAPPTSKRAPSLQEMRLPLTANDPPKSLDEIPEGVNAVQVEMQFLAAGMNNILLHISDANLKAIPDEISRIHPLYDLTHEAIEEGLYTLPHNADQLEEFERVDDAFHDDLRALVAAARADDLPATAEAYGVLVQGCVSCHAQFRFAPTAGE